jgi:hypothetical protein
MNKFIYTALVMVCLASGQAFSANAKTDGVKQADRKELKQEYKSEFAEAETLFNAYKKLDLGNDPRLIELYAPTAQIEAGVERERGDIRVQKMNRETFAKEIATAFKDEHLCALKSEETYSKPHFKKSTLNGKPAVEVIFHGAAGHAGIKVTWLLQPDDAGRMLIVSERSVTYNKRKAAPQ